MVHKISLVLPEDGDRLDRLLAKLLSEEKLSRSAVKALIVSGGVTVDGRPAKPSMAAKVGQRVEIEVPEKPLNTVTPLNYPLAVIYEDTSCFVVDKPSGMVTHPAKGHWNDTLVNALVGLGAPLSAGFVEGRPGIVHRLDKETSGVLLVAKNDRAQAFLAEQFKERRVEKVYEALVWGHFASDDVEVAEPIGRDPKNGKRMAIRRNGKPSQTSFKVLERLPHISLVEARPHTGRTHQIRVHLAFLHHPVVGDEIYGGRIEKGLPSAHLRKTVAEAHRFFLHARSLCFESPSAGKVTASAPLPPDFLSLMEVFSNHG